MAESGLILNDINDISPFSHRELNDLTCPARPASIKKGVAVDSSLWLSMRALLRAGAQLTYKGVSNTPLFLLAFGRSQDRISCVSGGWNALLLVWPPILNGDFMPLLVKSPGVFSEQTPGAFQYNGAMQNVSNGTFRRET